MIRPRLPATALAAQPQALYNTGEQLTQVILLRVVEGDLQEYLIWRQASGTVGVAIDGTGLTVYKAGGGLHYSMQTKLWEEVAPGQAQGQTGAQAGIAQEAISWSECMQNCIVEKLPGEIAEQLVKALAVGKVAYGCYKTASGDDGAVLECSKALDELIPGYGIGVELGTCNVDCEECETLGWRLYRRQVSLLHSRQI